MLEISRVSRKNHHPTKSHLQLSHSLKPDVTSYSGERMQAVSGNILDHLAIRASSKQKYTNQYFIVQVFDFKW